MKNLITFLLLLTSNGILAQERYLDEVFSGVNVTLDVEYSANTNFQLLTFFDSPMPLLMDVYEPMNDSLAERPVVVMLHDGYLVSNPDILVGTKQDSSIVEMASRLARMGYVAVSIDYRQGYNPLAATQPERAQSFLRAIYRAMQDTRSCNRYLRHSVVELNNPLGIDTSKMIVWGNGMGASIANLTASLDNNNELEITALTLPSGDFMINEEIDGNIYGTSTGLSPVGDTINHINYPDYSSDYHLSVNLQGYMIDTSMIDVNSPPIISYYRDGINHFCDTGFFNLSGNPNLQVSNFFGPCLITENALELGINEPLSDEIWLDSISLIANSNNNGLASLNYFQGNGLDTAFYNPWDWWNPQLLQNPASPNFATLQDAKESAFAYIDTILYYFTPRAYKALDLGLCPIDYSITNIIDFGNVSPNDTVYQTLSIVNTGTTAFSIEDIFADSDNLLINFDTTTIAPMDTIEITIGVFLEGGEELNEFINLTFSNGEQTSLQITAFNEEDILYEFTVPDTLDFGTITANELTSLSFLIENNGTNSFQISSVTSGLESINFVYNDTAIASGESYEIEVSTSLESGEVLLETFTITLDNGTQIEIVLLGNGDWVNAIESADLNNIRIFPNPSNGNIQLDFAGFSTGIEPVLLTIYDAVGKIVVYQIIENIPSQSLDLSMLDNGIYLVKLDGEQGSALKKITVF